MKIAIEEKLEFNADALASKVRSIRGRLTQAQFAEKLSELCSSGKISHMKISRWEEGRNEPSASELFAIAQFAKCSVDELVGLQKDSKNNSHLDDNFVQAVVRATANEIAQEVKQLLGASNRGTESMNLSSIAQARLRVLLRESLKDKGLTPLSAATWVGITGSAKLDFTRTLEAVLEGRGFLVNQPRLFLDGVAAICCQVKAWNQETLFEYSVEIISNSTHNSIESLVATLEHSLNGSGCR